MTRPASVTSRRNSSLRICWAVTLLLRVRGNSRIEGAALKGRRALSDKLAALVRAAVAEGAFRDDINPDVISWLLFGTVNSLVEWYDPAAP
jgi:hypothetical protein